MRRKVFPDTEISLVDRGDFGDEDEYNSMSRQQHFNLHFTKWGGGCKLKLNKTVYD